MNLRNASNLGIGRAFRKATTRFTTTDSGVSRGGKPAFDAPAEPVFGARTRLGAARAFRGRWRVGVAVRPVHPEGSWSVASPPASMSQWTETSP